MIIETAYDPVYADNTGLRINLNIVHPVYGIIPFTAYIDDTTEHGVDLYNRAVAGEFGQVAPYVPPNKPVDVIIKELTDAVQKYLDDTAKTRNYDGILSLCTYATSTNPTFAAEGQAGVIWRDAVWSTCYSIMTDVQLGNRSIPSETELIAELPVIQWPQ